MNNILRIGSAFIGVIVGAGFASGQEILQYFTSFGILGIFGAILSTALFSFIGMVLVWLGSYTQTNSHKDVIYRISGRYLGTLIDYILIFTLFGVGVVMIAGAGSNLNQQFGLPFFVGSTLMTIFVILTGLLKVNRVVSIIGGITPFLIFFVVLISIYSLLSMDASFASLNEVAQATPTTLPNWFISSINYVSFNVAVGASMSIVMGGTEKNPKIAAKGGLLGGLVLGIMIILSHLAIFSKIGDVGTLDMPMLGIVSNLSPVLGLIMSLVIFGMIYNTAIGMFFSFTARFAESGTKKFKIFFIITMIVGYLASYVGFTQLVSYFYPLIGYLGIVLMFALVAAPFIIKKQDKSK
ncbi:putative membrane protein YkvI [Lysinibacillus composti]|uniref:Membrane protein YkvI n=1 Tax=Lysinibacillus composti TaxID=720633 RepID=A0A3N9UF76_9BACI|nr:hypothetical protein [Lysinibacillus composti]MBM7608494.1 putative membrane protein YkvI [Lysinibacillus composti]RQW74785.1 hypothetical protein EBB45_09280 [Lysinibacillus composti]